MLPNLPTTNTGSPWANAHAGACPECGATDWDHCMKQLARRGMFYQLQLTFAHLRCRHCGWIFMACRHGSSAWDGDAIVTRLLVQE